MALSLLHLLHTSGGSEGMAEQITGPGNGGGAGRAPGVLLMVLLSTHA